MTARSTIPAVSIILPTYNRAAFLPAALESIKAQTFIDWELVIVDDGSTDETPELLPSLTAGLTQATRLVRRTNGGAYAARNSGLDQARGEFVAFFDSDDLWLPNHLERCVDALRSHPDVDWAFAACRMTDECGNEIAPSTFVVNGMPRPFLLLHAVQSGAFHIIEDPRTITCQILHGLYCGLQNSVIRARVFSKRRFREDYLVVEDEMFVIRLLAEGARFGYFLEPHVTYRVHGENSSGSATGTSTAKSRRLFEEMVRGLERIRDEVPLSAEARGALRERLAQERFWKLGYHGYWLTGDRTEALAHFSRAIREWPWDVSMWKTYVTALLRVAVRF